MGTNYYAQTQPPCECCKRPYEAKHIGKSSWGWFFSLRIYPNEGIKTLSDWKKYLADKLIFDEYDRDVSLADFLDVVKNRKGFSPHNVDGSFCVARGEGTWDLFVGDFS